MARNQNPNDLFDQQFESMQKTHSTIFGNFGKFAVATVVINLAILAFLGWAIYRLVMHFTG